MKRLLRHWMKMTVLAGGLALAGFGCAETMPRAAAPPPPSSVPDADVAAAQRQVQDHVNALAGARSRGTDFPVDASTPPPEINWSDPGWLAAHPRPTNRTFKGPKVVVARPKVAPAPPVAAPPPQEPKPTPVAAPPVAAKPSADRDELLGQLLERIRSSDDPVMAKALTTAGLSLADPDRTLDPQVLEPLSPSQREQVLKYHALIVALGRQLAAGEKLDITQISEQLNEAFAQPISIHQFALCRRVDGFGVYEPFESANFAAGRALKLGLYLELDHFASKSGDNDNFTVNLSQEVTLYTQDGLAVWREPAAEVIDRSRNRRRDFFTTQVIKLPANLGVGKYLLKVRVTDRNSNTIDESTLPLHLVTDPAMAGR